MSIDDASGATIQNRRRTAMPTDPSEDELAQHWSLTPADLAVIAECRGPDHRRRFALQLCMLRAHGHFLDDYRHAPIKIVNHLARQLGLAPVLFLDRPGRAQTERAQSLRIRRHLGIRSFDRHAAADLQDWLRQGALEGRTAAELMARAEDRLREWRVMLPAPSTLERLVTAEVTRATTDLYTKVSHLLPPSLHEAIDLLVEVPEGDARSSLFRLKDYPKSANAAVIKGDIVRLRLIEQLLDTGAGLDDLDPQIIRQLGQLGRRYDAGDLRRFAKPKRDALVACYLVEARKTLIDQIVEMNDQFLIGMNRRARGSVEDQRKSLRRRARDGCTACSAPSMNWSRPMARKHSTPSVMRWVRQHWWRPPSRAGRMSGWKSVATSMPCSRATARCGNICPPSLPCHSRPPPVAKHCSVPSKSSAPWMPALVAR
jgi:hypothetical protein